MNVTFSLVWIHTRLKWINILITFSHGDVEVDQDNDDYYDCNDAYDDKDDTTNDNDYILDNVDHDNDDLHNDVQDKYDDNFND